jgi:4'-phosphopantetheinyl transferase EntD
MPPRRLQPALLAELLPANVSCALERLPTADSPQLPQFQFPEEAAEVASAILKRQREYASGRNLAHELLLAKGAPPSPLLSGAKGAPRWPVGFTGSISHCDGLCVAAICSTDSHTAIGIDVELAKPLQEKLWSRVLVPSEADRFEVLGERGALLAMAHFSAKEALYKLIASEFGRLVGFREVELRFSLTKGTFTAHGGATEKERARLGDVRGRWRITPRHILTTSFWAAN